ncbi:DUF2078 family protein [Natronomonas pharaonis DSM 2160]|uniref:DUF2078 family protein n=1 Tax=Natronomonas pharaonis (strain ATCC 35678 / DSM 2160 / CIP 103997 / JCM 8858 / NBRC 14720 / NCIMB 2260 / Gabara) TaxID=348780 RepID=A0A1U7EXL2_NATPD|nr:SHOCT domain-containing protein [Natronomonas pharaonis]CAI49898.1 DUF2078 family protein [Natronomonas pharaonis DSM 2160]
MDEEDTEPLVTHEMLGYMLGFGLDFILLAGLLWVVGVVPGVVFAGVTGFFAVVYTLWIAWRWHSRRRDDSADREPVDALKERYVAGELSEAEFEAELSRLMDAGPDADGREQKTSDRTAAETASDRQEAAESE